MTRNSQSVTRCRPTKDTTTGTTARALIWPIGASKLTSASNSDDPSAKTHSRRYRIIPAD
jgi:hypothetical protein